MNDDPCKTIGVEVNVESSRIIEAVRLEPVMVLDTMDTVEVASDDAKYKVEATEDQLICVAVMVTDATAPPKWKSLDAVAVRVDVAKENEVCVTVEAKK